MNSQGLLPLEIWEIIWSNLCVEDLTRSERVSSFWYTNIKKIIKNEDWQDKCIAEIPTGILYSLFREICGNVFDKKSIKPDVWFEIYKTLKLWEKNYSNGSISDVISINKKNEKKKTDEFSCMAIHGDILALGTMNGFIYFYHLSNLKQSFFIADHLEWVIKVEFWETDDGVRGVSQCQHEKIKFWDLNRKKEDKNFFSYGSFMVASGDIFYTSSCGDDRISVRCGASICKFKKSQFQEITMGEHKLYIDDDYYPSNSTIKNFQAEDYGDTKILSITSIDKNYIGIYEVHYTSGLFVYGLKEVEQLPDIINESTIKKIYVYDHVTFILAYDSICINIPGRLWTVYNNIFMKLRGVIKCIAYHANLLILGLDSGELHVIKLNNQNELENLNLNSCNKKIYMLDYLPIININFSMRCNKRFIFAMTSSKVFVLKLE